MQPRVDYDSQSTRLNRGCSMSLKRSTAPIMHVLLMRIRWTEVHVIDAHQSARFDPTYHTSPRRLPIAILDGT